MMFCRRSVIITTTITKSRFSHSFIGHPGQDFDWADYLKQCGAEAAPENCFPSVSVHCHKVGNYCTSNAFRESLPNTL